MGRARLRPGDDSSAEIGRRIDSLHDEDIRFLQDLRDRAVRRSRELGEIIRRGRKGTIKRG